jgi:hypothetical protein
MLKGRSYDQIAREVGYANCGAAHRVVAKAWSERLADDIDQLREMELARLDALQASMWAKAENGDLRAVNAYVRIIDKRCRLLGPVRVQGTAGAVADPRDRSPGQPWEGNRQRDRVHSEPQPGAALHRCCAISVVTRRGSHRRTHPIWPWLR